MAYKKSGETRERILKAAARLFAERGYYETGIGDIADAAGIGRASVYYYFPDKEKVARALYDSIVDRIFTTTMRLVGEDEDLFLEILIEYILLFRYVALNKTTQAVFYDLVHFADYDEANIERLKRTVFRDAKRLSALSGVRLSEKRLTANIITSDAFAKSLFKGIINGTLDFSLEEAMDFFSRRIILPDAPVPEAEYRRKLKEAFRRCEGVAID